MVGVGHGLHGRYRPRFDPELAADVWIDTGAETGLEGSEFPEVAGRQTEAGEKPPVITVTKREIQVG